MPNTTSSGFLYDSLRLSASASEPDLSKVNKNSQIPPSNRSTCSFESSKSGKKKGANVKPKDRKRSSSKSNITQESLEEFNRRNEADAKKISSSTAYYRGLNDSMLIIARQRNSSMSTPFTSSSVLTVFGKIGASCFKSHTDFIEHKKLSSSKSNLTEESLEELNRRNEADAKKISNSTPYYRGLTDSKLIIARQRNSSMSTPFTSSSVLTVFGKIQEWGASCFKSHTDSIDHKKLSSSKSNLTEESLEELSRRNEADAKKISNSTPYYRGLTDSTLIITRQRNSSMSSPGRDSFANAVTSSSILTVFGKIHEWGSGREPRPNPKYLD